MTRTPVLRWQLRMEFFYRDMRRETVLKNWSLGITVVDSLWGAVLSAIVSTTTWAVLRRARKMGG